MAFPRALRLRDARSIKLLFEKGVATKTPFFRMFALPSFSGQWQVGVIVSVKTEASAVKRNRIRRRITEAMRMLIQAHSAELSPRMLLFVGKNTVLDADFLTIKHAIQQNLK